MMQRPTLAVRTAGSITAMLLLATGWAGCHNPDDYALNSDESPSVDRFLSLEATAGATTLPADGVSAVELVARVRDVSEGPVSVQFTTTAGSLRVGSTVGALAFIDSVNTELRTDSVAVRTDAAGEARAELISAPQPGTARVRATVAGVDIPVEQVIRIDFTAVSNEALLAFVDAPDSAFAHGLSLVPVTVQIDARLQGPRRDVRFQTTGGVFPFGDSSAVQIVPVDADGRATAHLRSPQAPGEVQVRARVAGFSRHHRIRFVPAPVDSVLSFVNPPQRALADGETLTGFTVEISPRLQRLEDRTVAFTTTRGTFLLADGLGASASVRADADGRATAWLRSPSRFGEAVVRATVLGFRRDDRIFFDWAGPDSIVVNPDASRLQLAAGEQVLVIAELIRFDGKVTESLPVSFAATDSLGDPIPGVRFLNVKRTDVVGTATAMFAVEQQSDYEGPVTITARPVGLDSDVVGQTEVTILRP